MYAQATADRAKEGNEASGDSPGLLPAIAALHAIGSNHKLNNFATHERGFIAPVPLEGNVEYSEWRLPQYVPIEDQLLQVIHSDNGSGRIDFSPKSNEKGMYASMFDGHAHRNPDADTLYLVLYYDEFVLSNPLGNKTYEVSAKYSLVQGWTGHWTGNVLAIQGWAGVSARGSTSPSPGVLTHGHGCPRLRFSARELGLGWCQCS